MNFIKKFIKEEDGLGTVEIVLLIAVLIAIALIFGGQIKEWVGKLIESVTGGGDDALDEIQSRNI